MTELISFRAGESGQVLFEVSDEETGVVLAAKRPGELAADVGESLESALAPLVPAAEAVEHKIRTLDRQPEEVQVEFGLILSAKGLAVIVAAGVDAHFKVAITWKRPG